MNSMKKQTNKPTILWDIHDVLLKRSGIMTTLWNYNDWWNTITNSSFGLVKDLMGLAMSHLISGSSSEQFIQRAQAHNNPYMKHLITQLTNSQQPIPGMKQITDELHAAGCEQHIASNIGSTPFRVLTDPNKLPHLAPTFVHMNIEKSFVVSNDTGTFVKKPDPQFFSMYLQKNGLNPHSQPIIFIDDNAKNVAAAQTVGIDAILFKNPTQLRNELQKRAVLLPQADQ